MPMKAKTKRNLSWHDYFLEKMMMFMFVKLNQIGLFLKLMIRKSYSIL